MRADRGFSVIETLLALLLFAIGLTALLHYQQALTQGFYRQWQQREAWRIAALRLQGEESEGWAATLQTLPGPEGCQLWQTSVARPALPLITLSQLRCDE
ncbi:MAG: prepilin-type N-terminal cleavage/methylation domain-containing protein [Mixta calida]|jgi:prepilin peptidase dependent protein C|uniref:type IV pilus modification PilV family protein n=1 Tax=Mixta calida TaxID=665913 RepID=UPI00289E811C|nr:prepilin-type N-terminal cleavage/methylation domain-containing protein [Mixta calida]MBS6058394.1 prepilin-type N-terminal cleavage/methylation domain-containing protein [Pantoea sp.]MDU2732338.1 prepilin-type N-terminal cleavage/methylation domain-containing protein [Mixta calida]MDU4289360.1 prepilin-type N-terminal cleavage/methylation domain-containing protein [Mixta calida]MDU5191470.1 prepilin-type N-terminal cleavage/methylation domain-containing protein [Mixta calida]